MIQNKTVSSCAPVRSEAKRQLAIHIVVTSDRETAAALRQAAGLAAGLNARLVVIAPQVVPWAAEIDHPPVSPEFTTSRVLHLIAQAEVDAEVHVVLCRDRMEGVESVLGTNSVVIAGENRLTRQLTKRGHQVLRVDTFASAERKS